MAMICRDGERESGEEGKEVGHEGLSIMFLCCSISLAQMGEQGGNTPSLPLLARHPHGLCCNFLV